MYTKRDMDPNFLFYWFLLMGKSISEMGSGSTVMELSLSQLKRIPPLKPGLHEQSAIAAVLSDMDAEIDSLELKLAKYRNIKQGMMQELLTGRIRLV